MSRVLWGTQAGRARFLGSPRSVLLALLPKVWVSLLFEPRDLWVGVYWKRPDVAWAHALDVYVCAVPCLPLLVQLRLGTRHQVRCEAWRAWRAWRRDEDQWDEDR